MRKKKICICKFVLLDNLKIALFFWFRRINFLDQFLTPNVIKVLLLTQGHVTLYRTKRPTCSFIKLAVRTVYRLNYRESHENNICILRRRMMMLVVVHCAYPVHFCLITSRIKESINIYIIFLIYIYIL